MAPKKQKSLQTMFGWSKPTSSFVDPEVELNENELENDMDMFGVNLDSGQTTQSIAERGESSQGLALAKSKRSVVRGFREIWKTKYPWLRSFKCGDKPIMKCSWCEKYKIVGSWGTGEGCKNMQHDAIVTHAKSSGHRLAQAQWTCDVEKQAKSIPRHVIEIDAANREKIITTMKLMHFVAKNDLPLTLYEDQCELAMALNVPNMPNMAHYASYTNRKSGADFLVAIAQHLREVQCAAMLESPFFSLMVDESTDRALELHLVVYVTYLTNKGLGPKITSFMNLSTIIDGKGKTLFDALKALMHGWNLDQNKLVAIATDGASAMMGSEVGLVTLLKNEIPHLFNIHCIAHREALAASDASKGFPEIMFVEKLANKVYTWVSNSSKRNNELMNLLELMDIETHQVLRVHGVRWLSRGEVMERLVQQMPAILCAWKTQKLGVWYDRARIYVVQFCFHLLADVLKELNVLNKKFQEENVDLTLIGSSIDVTVRNLRRMFLREGSFACDTTYLSQFMDASKYGYLEMKDKEGNFHHHELIFSDVHDSRDKEDVAGTRHLDSSLMGSKSTCIDLAKRYVVKVIEALDARFPDLSVYNSAKLFSPVHYAEDAIVRERNAERWLANLLQHFRQPDGIDLNTPLVFDRDSCRKELFGFIDTLHLNCEGFSMKESWRIFSITKDWQDSFPNMMQLWQAIYVIPASTVQCERGFSKQNMIKDIRRTQLSIDTLNSLMRVSVNGPDLMSVEWQRVFEIWRETKDRRIVDDIMI